jgi:hypothetical protein
VRASLAAALTIAALPATVFARQSAPPAGKGWVRGAAVVTWQAEGRSDCPYLCGPLGGSGVGASAGAGVWVTPRLAVVIEATRGAVLEGPQQIRVAAGYLDSSARHRDTIVSGGLAVSLVNPRRAVSLDVVGLAGAARRRTVRDGTRHRFTSTDVTVYDELLVDTVPAVGVGMDLRFALARHLALVPSFRGHYLFDDDTLDDGPPKRGVGSVIAVAGVGLAVSF